MSRQKGNEAERDVAKLLEAWWQTYEPDARFVRTPLSGGWGGPTLRGDFGAAGDLMTTSKEFPFAVEVKRREGWTWERLLVGKPSPVWDWWRQAQDQADEMKKIPTLWIRKNREKVWRVMLPAKELALWDVEPEHTWNMSRLNVGETPAVLSAPSLFELEPVRVLVTF